MQLCGEKVWHLRPTKEILEIDGFVWAEGTEITIRCCPGDILLVNTRLWKHRTEIPPMKRGFSISFARDIYVDDSRRNTLPSDMTNVTGAFACRDMQIGEIVARSDEDPNIELEESGVLSKCNCELVEIESSDNGENIYAIVTTKPVKKGDWFISFSE